MKDNTTNTDRSAEYPAEENARKTANEGSKPLSQEKAEEKPKKQPAAGGKEKSSPKAPPKAEGKPKAKAAKEKVSPKEDGKKPATNPAPGKKPRKSHKKKGTANDAPPSSVGMTQLGFAALLAIEAANPEMTRKQAIENALRLYAGHIAYLPALQLARLDSDSLITLAGVAAQREKSYKKILRQIYLSELDDKEKSKHSRLMEKEIQRLQEDRQVMHRMAGIPVSHDLTTLLDPAIALLKEGLKKGPTTSDENIISYQNAIEILTAYQPFTPMETVKPAPKTAGNPEDQDTPDETES